MILNLLRGVSATAPTSVYMGLYLNNPGESGAGVEVSYSGYTRKAVTFSAPAAMSGGIGIKNSEEVTFTQTPSAVGTVTHIGLHDSSVGGNMLLYAELTEPLSIDANEAPVIVTGEAMWWLTGAMSTAYKTKVLNLLRGINCAGFSPYLALFNGNPEGGGSELSGTGYARVPLTFGAPSEQASGQMQITTSVRASTERATTSWGTWSYTAVFDATSNGQPVFYAERTPKVMRKGLLAIVDAGSLSLAVH
jgi:hypothetical protein